MMAMVACSTRGASAAATVDPMALPEDAGSTPLLTEWIAEVGEEEVVAVVEETRRRVADGSLPSFDNSADLLAFVRRGHRQTA